jgi:16S rRNA (cytosine1402-N4)-methyltransferase
LSRRSRHQPVLLAESLAVLAPGPGRLLVDGTVGDGGHAEAWLERSGPDGRLLGLDRDAEALAEAAGRLAPFGGRVELVHASFRELAAVLADRGIARVDAILLDLGVSSHQLDEPRRGFRFGDGAGGTTPLDMRMDPSESASAAELLATAPEAQLADWFRRYGELPGAHRLARAIVERRADAPIRSAADLLRVIESAGVGRGRRHHPATLVFQALRIAVNDELAALDDVLDAAPKLLAAGGRLCVIAYHSLEDRIVKRKLQELERGCICPPRDPVCTCGRRPTLRRLQRRPIRPSPAEVARNPRARSARLRAAERLAEAA